MPMKPHKDESQSDFMSRCVPETIGTGKDKRPQEQAVAICLDYWREAHPGSAPKPKAADEVRRIIALWCMLIEKQADVPDPEDGEGHQDFMDRCLDELDDLDPADAEDACELAWENSDNYQNESGDGLVHKMHTTDGAGLEFILSDETPDRFGDIISAAGWDFTNFTRNPVCLFNHNPDFIVGLWESIGMKTNEKALRGHLRLAPAGTSARIDEIRKLVEADILRAVSVGFKPKKSEPIDPEARDPFGMGPTRYLRQELVECSLVAIPANPNALAVAKSLRISPETQNLVFGKYAIRGGSGRGTSSASGKHATARREDKNGKHATIHSNTRGSAMSGLSQRIIDKQNVVKALCAKLDEHVSNLDDSNISDKDMEITTKLNEDIARERKALTMLEDTEKSLAGTVGGGNSGGGNGTGSGSRSLVVRHSENNNGGDRNGAIDDAERERRKQFFRQPGEKELKPLDYVVRQGVVTYLARALNRLPDDICKSYEPYSDEKTRFIVDWNMRTAVNPAMTTVAGWAAELVQTIYADYMALLMPKSLFPRLSALGLSLQFGRAGQISIPTRSATPTIAGSFVGEGMPIPVRRGAFTAQILTPKKLAVITTWTKEIDEHSIPAIESLLREAIGEDTAIAIDTVLIDANPATAVRPPGLLNGVTPIAATAGGGFAAIVGDLKNVSGALLTATRGNVRNPAFLMNPVDVNSAKFITFPTGAWAFRDEIARGRLNDWPIIDSTTVTPKSLIAIDAADFVTVGAEGPRFEISDQATLHEEDTTPLPIVGGSPGTPASPVRSLWQTDTLALRMIQRLNWALRRTGMVAEVTNVTW